ncbi:transcriptional repressor [Candidatus Nomurabacteria bacterium]|nr:transcriptional repressor [Candidatus Nomurabacteria bacterium]
MGRRNTIQKQLVLDAVSKFMGHPSAEEVYNSIVESYPDISKATVYRNLNHLVDSGQLLRLTVPGSADKYDATVSNHCHALCKYCDKFIDLELENPVVIDFNDKALKENMVDDFVILFTGICPDCMEQKRKIKD